jgi:shikimate 5-dehydrogenase
MNCVTTDKKRTRLISLLQQLAYNPLETPLLKQIRALSVRGWIAVHGLEVLPEQAYAQFELFTGRPAPKRLMEAQILKHLGTSQ